MSSIVGKDFDLKFQITNAQDGQPVAFCRECVELLFFQWAKHVWEESKPSDKHNLSKDELTACLVRAIQINERLKRAIQNFRE